jgi:glucosylceramidase
VVTIDDSVSPAQVTFNVEYYILGHLGKFVLAGAHRIDSNTFGASSIEDVAFQNPDGSIVLLVLNSAANAETFTVSFKGQSFDYMLPAGALATFSWSDLDSLGTRESWYPGRAGQPLPTPSAALAGGGWTGGWD